MDPVDHHASAGAYGHYASYGSPVVAQVGGPGAGAPHLPGGPASLPGGTDASGPGVASCLLFEFVLHLVLCGALCLLGFVGNGVSFAALWNQQRHPTAVTFLLQGAIIADLALLWVVFLERVVPGLAFAVPLLRDCAAATYRISAVTRPLAALAQAGVTWLTLCAALNRYWVLTRPSSSSLVGTLDFARRQVVLLLVVAVVVALPLTFDSSVTVAHVHLAPSSSGDQAPLHHVLHTERLRHNSLYRRIYVLGVLSVTTLLVPWLCVVYVAARLGHVLHSVKRLQRVLSDHATGSDPYATGSQHHVTRHQPRPTGSRLQVTGSEAHVLTGSQHNTELTQVALTLCITLGVCYMPAVVQTGVLWARPDAPWGCGTLHYYLDSFVTMFKVLNSSLKLPLLLLFQPRFPELLRDTFCAPGPAPWWCCCCRKRRCGHNRKCAPGFRGYRCEDMSEMTLMSQCGEEPPDNSRI